MPRLTHPAFAAMSSAPEGATLPSSGRAKSCTRTASGWPLGRSSRPPFLKSPTSSFFFVSTEIAGWPAVWQAFTRALMYSNWASRSGWLVPSRVLRLACRLKPSRRSSRPTSFWPAAKPRSVSARARWRWLLLAHSKAASGSPRMADCTSSPKASSRPGCVSTAGLRPPPGRRMRLPRSCRPRRSSARPRPMVLRGTPVAGCLTPRVGGQDRGASYDVESARETAVGKAASSLHKPPTGRGPSSRGPVAGHPHFDPVRGAGRRVRELVLLQFHYRVVVARLGQSRLRLLLRFGPYVCAAPVLQDARGGAVRRTIENPITVIAALSGLLGRHSHRCGLHLCLLVQFQLTLFGWRACVMC